MASHGDASRYTTDDLATAYRQKRVSTDRKLDAAKKNFAAAVNGIERLIENKSSAYVLSGEEIHAFLNGGRKALDELEIAWSRKQEPRGPGWRWS